jgi:hypothetical protein
LGENMKRGTRKEETLEWRKRKRKEKERKI